MSAALASKHDLEHVDLTAVVAGNRKSAVRCDGAASEWRIRREHSELITARAPNPQSERNDPTNVRDMRQQAQNSSRLFTLFFDRWQVQLSGPGRAR